MSNMEACGAVILDRKKLLAEVKYTARQLNLMDEITFFWEILIFRNVALSGTHVE